MKLFTQFDVASTLLFSKPSWKTRLYKMLFFLGSYVPWSRFWLAAPRFASSKASKYVNTSRNETPVKQWYRWRNIRMVIPAHVVLRQRIDLLSSIWILRNFEGRKTTSRNIARAMSKRRFSSIRDSRRRESEHICVVTGHARIKAQPVHENTCREKDLGQILMQKSFPACINQEIHTEWRIWIYRRCN